MKKFICALSSFVLAATAMGSSVAMSSNAATNGNVDKTIFAFRSDGKSEVNVKAGDTVPVSLYIPQSSGFNSLSLKMAIGKDGNLKDTLGKGTVEDREGNKIENYKDAFSFYGIKMVTKGGEVPDGKKTLKSDFTYPNMLHSGALTGYSEDAGDIEHTCMPMFNSDEWSILFKFGTELMKTKKNMDSYDAWVAAGGSIEEDFDYDNYTPVFTWTKDESWAYKTTFAQFDLILPSDLPDGQYVLDLYRDTFINCHPSSLFTDDNKWKEDSKRGEGKTAVSGVEGAKEYDSEKLIINVGDVSKTEPSSEKTETTTTKTETTKAPTDTTKSSSTVSDKAIIYNLVPSKGDYEKAEETGKARNVYKAKPGEDLTVNWTIRNDQGTAGIQMNFDFTQVEYKGASKGKAYRITPTFSDYESGKGLQKGEVTYAFAQSSEAEANDDAVIYSFDLKVPEEKGTYTLDLVRNNAKLVNKVVPTDQDQPHEWVFYGLDVVVDGEPSDTTKASTDTTKTTSDTTKSSSSDTKVEIGEKTIVYNLVPSKGDYQKAEEIGGQYNIVKAKPGDDIDVNWTIRNDQGTAGIQMNFDFTQVEYKGASKGKAYRITPTFSDYESGKGLQKGEVTYAFAQSSEAEANDDAVIYTFNLKVPDKADTYTLDLVRNNAKLVNKVVPTDQDKPHDWVFFGLKIVAEDETTDTTSTSSDTTTTETTTTKLTTVTETSSSKSETETTSTKSETSSSNEEGSVLYGDVNCSGDVRINDVVLLNKYLAKNTSNVTKQGLLNADCEKDDKVDAKDATKIKQYLALLIDKSELGKKSN